MKFLCYFVLMSWALLLMLLRCMHLRPISTDDVSKTNHKKKKKKNHRISPSLVIYIRKRKMSSWVKILFPVSVNCFGLPPVDIPAWIYLPFKTKHIRFLPLRVWLVNHLIWTLAVYILQNVFRVPNPSIIWSYMVLTLLKLWKVKTIKFHYYIPYPHTSFYLCTIILL